MAKEFKRSSNNNVRQLGTADNSNQNQILSALDILGAKLVRSESERETMRKLLNEALDAQDRLETQLERSSIDIQRRIDLMEREEKSLSDADRQWIEDQQKNSGFNQEILDDTQKRQRSVEDKLRDSQQTITKLQRRLDSQEQKRAKLQRRIERVENIAADAQNALDAKALVLLTNYSEKIRNLEFMQTTDTHDANVLDNDTALPLQSQTQSSTAMPHTYQTNKLLGATSWFAIAAALVIGWGVATYFNTSDKAFFVMGNGQLAQVDLSDGTAKPINMVEPDQTASSMIETQSLSQSQSIEEDLAILSTDWVTESIFFDDEGITIAQDTQPVGHSSEYDVLQTMLSDDITMDRDLSLPVEIQELEAKAFDLVPEAQHDLAALYIAGQMGVAQNYERAAFWFRQAADRGIGNAAYNLGVLFQQGLGQAQDLQRALDWYRRAAQLNHPEAYYNLGIAYIEGVGTRYNPAMAAAFFQRAALSGIAEASYNLGLILENGLLGEIKSNDALIWYRAAATQGNTEAEQALTTLAQSLDRDITTAGYLANGETLSTFIEGASANTQLPAEISLIDLIPNDEQIMIAQIQEQLRKARLYNGPQDGIIGAGTVKAIRSYQKQNELPINGNATNDLLTYMLRSGTVS